MCCYQQCSVLLLWLCYKYCPSLWCAEQVFWFPCRPLPPLPNLEVSDVSVEKAADRALVWINRVLAVGHDIAIKRDRKVFIQVCLFLWDSQFLSHYCISVPNYVCSFFLFSSLQKVILILWVVSYIGMLFNFLTLIYIGEFCKLLLHGYLDRLFSYYTAMCILSLLFCPFLRGNAFAFGSTTLWEVPGSCWWKARCSTQCTITAPRYHHYQGRAISQAEEDRVKEMFCCIVVSFNMTWNIIFVHGMKQIQLNNFMSDLTVY